MYDEWEGFEGNKWQIDIDVESFIDSNYKEYTGDKSFLAGVTDKNKKVWDKCLKLTEDEIKTKTIKH